MFPEQLKQLLRHQIEEVKMTCARNIKEMEGEVCLPRDQKGRMGVKDRGYVGIEKRCTAQGQGAGKNGFRC